MSPIDGYWPLNASRERRPNLPTRRCRFPAFSELKRMWLLSGTAAAGEAPDQDPPGRLPWIPLPRHDQSVQHGCSRPCRLGRGAEAGKEDHYNGIGDGGHRTGAGRQVRRTWWDSELARRERAEAQPRGVLLLGMGGIAHRPEAGCRAR